ncbi:MAG: hypothetical protein SCH70_09650 [Candidatus Methanoperedens sp.]|nr:hypothetical protein [Candidatus Methanoperedens sp.]
MNGESTLAAIARIDERTKLMAEKIEDMSHTISRLDEMLKKVTEKTLRLEASKGYCPAHPDMVKAQAGLREENIVLKTKFGMVSVLVAGFVTLLLNFSLWLLDKYVSWKG